MHTEQHTGTLIVGAGPAGLAVAGRLTRLGLPFLIVEKAEALTPSWRNHYDRLCLHTTKEHSNLPGMDMPEHYPVYVPRLDLVAYYENYCREMGITPLFGQEVQRIRRQPEGWLTETPGCRFFSKNVVVATGYNRVPVLPDYPGQESFPGPFFHSREYRNAAPVAGKKVLLIGIGNTGAELALDLCENGANPVISVRGPVNFIRRDIAGRPAQRTAIFLSRLPDRLYDGIARFIQRITVGDLSAYGLLPSPYAPSEQLRRFGKVPVIDIGTIDRIKAGDIRIMPGIREFQSNEVIFENGQTEAFDVVIACTGYRAQVEDFLENAAPLLNERGYPSRLWFDAPEYRGLYFCGFTSPISGILRNIKIDSKKIAAQIQAVEAN
ncbi:MAG: NAD(P)/FAD-dependent oxidoreductase [Lewinellaceae bacterium]|nr:NAD(P)/FAD-dependent oxidoreductase [Lewinellaceae bacterium]